MLWSPVAHTLHVHTIILCHHPMPSPHTIAPSHHHTNPTRTTTHTTTRTTTRTNRAVTCASALATAAIPPEILNSRSSMPTSPPSTCRESHTPGEPWVRRWVGGRGREGTMHGQVACMAVWWCGGVAVWRCGGVAVWQCGRVAGWQGGRAAGWQGSRERRRVAGWWDGGWVVGWAGAKRT